MERAVVLVYRVYCVNIDSILKWLCEVLRTGDGLKFTVCALCYTWEMALHAGLDISFDNM
jgi:hypothetical protein